MAVSVDEWLALIGREYLRRFVPSGGAAVKFVMGDDDVLAGVRRRLEALAGERGFPFVAVEAATTKLHMIQDVFFVIARSIDWDALAQCWVEAAFAENRYEWPRPGEPVSIQELSDANRIDERLLKREVQQWLTAAVMRDRDMAQDFRSAMTNLCLRRMEMADERAGAPVIEWLRGELRTIGSVRAVPINTKITRHNGRAMLRSLCRWLRLCGDPGLVVALDLCAINRSPALADAGLRYTPAAVLDVFEVLRQLIDDTESFESLFVAVLADPTFDGDDRKRSLSAYTALKERIWMDVHARGHENPLAPLLRLVESQEAPRSGMTDASREMPFGEERVAVEALRAGVPNRAAIRLLGSSQQDLSDRFLERLRQTRERLNAGRPTQGEFIAGDFGSGKSHLLGYLAERALRENFIVSRVAISKETPLFDAERLYAAAIRNAVVPGANDDVMTAAINRLDPRSSAFAQLEEWASEQAKLSLFSPLFAALLHLMPRQVTQAEELAAIVRFFGGAKLGVAKVRQWLRGAGALKFFDVRPVKASELALQRLRFAPRLFSAAGYAGWCVLLDEIELIGRYTALQRGKSYAELCRWLGLADDVGTPGIVSLCAITEDFKSVVLHGRLDQEKIPRLLESKGLTRQARLAEMAMSAIEQRQDFLAAPDEDRLRRGLESVREIYAKSYGWTPPVGDIGERRSKKTMREYTKSWITDWDIQRLYGEKDEIATETARF